MKKVLTIAFAICVTILIGLLITNPSREAFQNFISSKYAPPELNRCAYGRTKNYLLYSIYQIKYNDAYTGGYYIDTYCGVTANFIQILPRITHGEVHESQGIKPPFDPTQPYTIVPNAQ